VRSIEAHALRTPATLELRFTLEGEIAGLALPTARASRRADRLWQHTCFEAFIAAEGDAGYVELNFSPSTEWAIYRFSSYREGMAGVDTAQPPSITVTSESNRLILDAAIDLEPLAELRDSSALRVALCAVVEETDRGLSYWALAHPAGKPDFHHAAGFALALRREAGVRGS